MPRTFANLLANTFFSITGYAAQPRVPKPLKAVMPRVSLRPATTLALLTLCFCCSLILSARVAASDTQQKRQAKPAVAAAAFVVTKIADTNDGVCDADCSLREAINAANATAGASTITFALPADSVITLSNGELIINSNLTIDGADSPRLIVDANSTSRIFVVNAGLIASISNLTMTNGRDVPFISFGGGCIFNAGTLSLTNAAVSNGLARFGNGGGILNTGTLTLLNTTVSGSGSPNQDGGGGIYNSGTLTVTNSTVANNGFIAGFGTSRGGGILNINGNVTITNSTFSNNRAFGGGAIYTSNGTLVVTGSTFDGNTTSNSGGCIVFAGGINSLSNSIITNSYINQGSGGGIINEGTLTITGSTISNNNARDGDGGGILNNGTLNMANSAITANHSYFGGIGIANRGTLNISDSTISNNSGGGPDGGGVANSGTLSVRNSTINNNTSGHGGLLNSGGTMRVSNSTITNNISSWEGGAITNNSGGRLTVTSSTVSHNSNPLNPPNGEGCGGIYNVGSIVNISNTIVANNSAPSRPDLWGAFNSQGHNLIGVIDGGAGFGASGDQTGTASSPIDPLLGPLQNNGSATWTRALLTGSPALDTGETTLPTDQRGIPRPQGAASDIGAFELESNETPTFVAVSGTVTFEGHGLAGVTVTLSGDANATTTTDANGFYFFTNLNGGAYTVSVSKPDFNFTPASRNVISNNRNQAADFIATSTLNNGPPSNGRVLISEFRLQGPTPTSTPVVSGNEQGQLDEFIELYNNTDAPQEITGYKIETSSGFTISLTNGASIPARGHFLLTNAGYSLGSYAAPDLSYQGFDLEAVTGLALLDSSSNVVDAVGFTGSPVTFREGTGLSQMPMPSGQYSFVRKLASGRPQDTGNTAADFIAVATNASSLSILGAPGPENASSPIVRASAQIPGNYIDPMACGSCPPNRVVEGTSDRILKIRRTYTNLTGGDITRLRFRVIDLTTFNNQASGEASLTVISSNAEVINLINGATKTANALTREEPPNQSMYNGGINSTIADNTITLASPLPNNATVSVNYWLRIIYGGRFRFFVNIEALP